jgi:hypothetical protein
MFIKYIAPVRLHDILFIVRVVMKVSITDMGLQTNEIIA